MTSGVFGRGGGKQTPREAHPDQPWLWRDDWAAGRISSSVQAGLLFGWVFTALWNLFSWGLVYLIWPEDWRALADQGDYRFLLPLIFPLIGFGMLLFAIKSTLAWWKFGSSFLVLETVPGVVGGWLQGAIHTRISQAPPSPFLLTLSCFERVTTRTRTGSKTSTNTFVKTLWSAERDIAPESLYPAPRGLAVPVSIYVPYEQRPTDFSDPDREIRWQLDVVAETRGLNYKAAFEVPVFITPESRPETREERLARTRRVMESAEPEVQLPSQVLTRTIPGGIEYDFRIATKPGQGIGCAAVTLAVAVASGAGLYLGWPMALTAGLAVAALICVALLAVMFFSMERLTLEGDHVLSRRFLFGFRFGARRVAAAAVTRVEPTLLVDGGRRNRGKGKKDSWQVTLRVQGEDALEVGALSDKRVATRLAAEIEKRILETGGGRR